MLRCGGSTSCTVSSQESRVQDLALNYHRVHGHNRENEGKGGYGEGETGRGSTRRRGGSGRGSGGGGVGTVGEGEGKEGWRQEGADYRRIYCLALLWPDPKTLEKENCSYLRWLA